MKITMLSVSRKPKNGSLLMVSIGLPFYQEKNQNEFREALDEALQL